MANILTAAEAANILRCASNDATMLQLLPMVDKFIQNATGHDWGSDSSVLPEAKSAAQMLLVMWYENPAMVASGISSLNFGLTAALTQLESIALGYKEFEGISSTGFISLPGVKEGDSVSSLVGIIGVSGDQSASFESVISQNGFIKQLSGSDFSDKWFRAFVKTPGEL